MIDSIDLRSTVRRVWRTIFEPGGVQHPTASFVVDDEFCTGLIASFNKLRKSYGYHPPIAAQHPDLVNELIGEQVDVDGIVYGLIGRLRRTESGGVEAQLRLNELGCRLEKMGALPYLSPSIYTAWVDPHTGETLAPCLREVSFVDVPHLKNLKNDLGVVYRLADEQDADFVGVVTQTEGLEMDKMEELLESLIERFGALEELLAAKAESAEVVEMEDETTEEVVVEMEDIEEDAEVVSMKERLIVLESQLKLQQAVNDVRSEHAHLDSEMVNDLAAVKMSDESRYQRLSSNISLSETPTAGTVGVSGNTSRPVGAIVSLAEDAINNGISRGRPLIKHLRAKGMADADINHALSDSDTSKRIADLYAARGAK